MRNEKKRHFGRSKLHFLRRAQTHSNSHAQNNSNGKEKKNKQKWHQANGKGIQYAMKKIKFSVQFFFVCLLSLSLRVLVLFAAFDFVQFNINYMLCVVPRCAIYLDVVARFFFFNCHFSHLVFIFIQCDCIICRVLCVWISLSAIHFSIYWQTSNNSDRDTECKSEGMK